MTPQEEIDDAIKDELYVGDYQYLCNIQTCLKQKPFDFRLIKLESLIRKRINEGLFFDIFNK